MRRVCLPALAAAVLMTSMLMAQIPTPTIVKKSPALDALIAADAAFEKLGEGFKWTEGPVWSRKGGFLLFSDIPNNVIQKWEPGKGMSVFVKPSGYHGSAPFTGPEPGTNGLTFDSAGRLVACMHGDRQVGRFEDGKWTALADKFEGKRLNSPNDLVFHSSGALYFTDPAVRPPRALGGQGKGTALPGRLSPRRRRRADAAHQRAERAKRPGLLTRREDALCRAIRSDEGDLDGVSRSRATAPWAEARCSWTRPTP